VSNNTALVESKAKHFPYIDYKDITEMKLNDFHAEKGFRIFEFSGKDFDSLKEMNSWNEEGNKASFNKLAITLKLGPSETIEIKVADIKMECYQNDFDKICDHLDLINISNAYKNKTTELGFDEKDETILALFT
jgi:hypothetical protein